MALWEKQWRADELVHGTLEKTLVNNPFIVNDGLEKIIAKKQTHWIQQSGQYTANF